MLHSFIINPTAGKGGLHNDLIQNINNVCNKHNLQFDVHLTTGIGDATKYANALCKSGEEIRIYAAGGDGTLNEVVNGVMGFDNVSVGVIPIGTGNDFVKYLAHKEIVKNKTVFDFSIFFDIERLVFCETALCDVMKINDRYAVNVCNTGFDSAAAKNMARFKNNLLFPKGSEYIAAVGYTFFQPFGQDYKILIDGKLNYSGNYLLCAIGNGGYYGGSFHALPKADISDGLLDVCLVKNISRITFIKLISYYKKGQHLDVAALKPHINYFKCKTIEISSTDEMDVSVDGEILKYDTAKVEIVPGVLRVIKGNRGG